MDSGVFTTKKIAVANTPFKTRKSHLVTYKSDPSKAWLDYCFRRN